MVLVMLQNIHLKEVVCLSTILVVPKKRREKRIKFECPAAFLDVGLKNTTNIGRIEPPSCSDGLCLGCSLPCYTVLNEDIQKGSGAFLGDSWFFFWRFQCRSSSFTLGMCPTPNELRYVRRGNNIQYYMTH